MSKEKQENYMEKIREQYMEKEPTRLDEVKALDAKVKRPANIFGYVFGSLGAIVMGGGMSLIMTDIGESFGMENTMTPGIVIGVIGMIMAIINYPIYKGMLSSRRKKYAEQILELSKTETKL